MNEQIHKNWIIEKELSKKLPSSILSNQYIGIDFGTSTTVASLVSPQNYQVKILPIVLNQPDEYGATIQHHLVNSVLAWKNKKLIWGQDAYRLKPHLTEGKDVFSSFKMKLGLAIGPTYPNTKLAAKRNIGAVVETAEDASREFFKGVLSSIKIALNNEYLEQYKFAFSVPASFEANQRRDLMLSLKENGITEAQCCLIDEPNAAFLSFIYQCTHEDNKHPLLQKLKQNSCNILVYDFGAGTCDVSVLQVDIAHNNFTSRNLAISRFTALGGDDIDRAIARHILVPQLLKQNRNFNPESRTIDEKITLILQATAEKLKISAIHWIISQKINYLSQLKNYLEITFEDYPVQIDAKQGIKLEKPTLSIKEFAAILDDFIGDFDGLHTPYHIISPIVDVMDKSGLIREDIDAVLFIGGSCINPLIQSCVMDYMQADGDNVEAVVPKDLRSHVSLGAAIHCFSYHGLKLDFIQPIVSESIFIITLNNELEMIIPASSELPSKTPFKTTLIVGKERQSIIELPICVGNKNKILGILSIFAEEDEYFVLGARIEVTASINHEKLLHVEAKIGTQCVETSLLNPLANEELKAKDIEILKAKQKFNQALLDYDGRPPVHIAKEYADICLDAGNYEYAADLYIAIERMDKSKDYSTSICYAYSCAGRKEKSNEWAEIAYKRKPNAVNAYNLSCKNYGEEKIRYLRLALTHDENYTSALVTLGEILKNRGEAEGEVLLTQALYDLQDSLYDDSGRERDYRDLISVCNLLDGYDQLKKSAESKLKALNKNENSLYSTENLAQSLKKEIGLKGNE